VSRRILCSNGEAESSASGRPLPGRIRAPETIENPVNFFWLHPRSPVTDRDGNSFLIRVDEGDNRSTLTVVDRVANKVQHNTTQAALVDSAPSVTATHIEHQIGPLLLGERTQLIKAVFNKGNDVDLINLERNCTRIVTTHLQKVREHAFKPVNLSDQQLDRSRVLFGEGIFLAIENISRQADGR
jgi:hypothetical protein